MKCICTRCNQEVYDEVKHVYECTGLDDASGTRLSKTIEQRLREKLERIKGWSETKAKFNFDVLPRAHFDDLCEMIKKAEEDVRLILQEALEEKDDFFLGLFWSWIGPGQVHPPFSSEQALRNWFTENFKNPKALGAEEKKERKFPKCSQCAKNIILGFEGWENDEGTWKCASCAGFHKEEPVPEATTAKSSVVQKEGENWREEFRSQFIASDEPQERNAYPFRISPTIHEEIERFIESELKSQALRHEEEIDAIKKSSEQYKDIKNFFS